MKRTLIITLIISILISLIGCSSDTTSNNDNTKNQKEITIVTYGGPNGEYNIYNYYPTLAGYIDRFQMETGIHVKVDKINANTHDEYIKKLNVKMYLKEGPELIHFSEGQNYSRYVDNGVALNVKGKIPNYEKIYKSLRYGDSFVPIAMTYVATVLNKKVLDELGVKEPGFDWTWEEYLKIKEEWLAKEPRYFNYSEYMDIVDNPLHGLEIINRDTQTIQLSNDKVKNIIKEARQKIFKGNYIIDPHYSYMDYYKMFFDYGSVEYSKNVEFDFRFEQDNEVLRPRFGALGLKSLVTGPRIEEEGILVLPRLEKDTGLRVSGFVINRNGKNTGAAIEFLNGLLSDDVQILMFNDLSNEAYPVNKAIEDKISQIEKKNNDNEESIRLRKYIIEKIERGVYKPYRQIDSMMYEFYQMIEEDLLKFIFADKPYTDEELTRELKKLESKYNIWLNE